MQSLQGLPGLQASFIPFMMGSIALIAYLSVRNIYLAKAARELCAKLDGVEDAFQKDSLIIQVSWFIKRYKVSNTALIVAIFAVMCFGLMIASNVEQVLAFFPRTIIPVPILFLVAGGTLATTATMISIYEAYIARHSLFTAIGTGIVTAKCVANRPVACSEFESLKRAIKGSIDEELFREIFESSEQSIPHGDEPIPQQGAAGR